MSTTTIAPSRQPGARLTVDVAGSHTRTAAGLRVKAKLNKRRYATGVGVTRAEMQRLALHPQWSPKSGLSSGKRVVVHGTPSSFDTL